MTYLATNSTFIRNKYLEWYIALMHKALAREISTGYTEKHHILPECMGGGNQKCNRVKLTAREHFIAHWLLTKFVIGKPRIGALRGLARFRESNKYQLRKLTSRQFEIVRKARAEAASLAQRGRKASTETRKKISQALMGIKRKPFSKLHRSRLSSTHLGKIHSKEVKQKMSRSHIGKKKTAKHLRNISKAMRGHVVSAETRRKISESLKRRLEKII